MRETNNKHINSIRNAITLLLFTCVNGILSFLVTKVIILNYGSDFNGLITTANQIINMLLIVESGFTIASNVALFTPLANNDDYAVSQIISTTKHAFIWIGSLFYVAGLIVIIIYSFFINSNVSQLEIISIMLMALFPTGLNLLIATKYLALFQSKQKEYVINLIKIVCCIFGQILVYVVGSMSINRIAVRAFMMINPLLVVVLTTILGRKVFHMYNTKIKPNYSLIKGTRDLLAQKMMGMAYSTLPTLVISVQIGTDNTSVYGVYNMVTILIKSIANAAINAPRMSLGALIAEGNDDRIAEIFKQYELIVLIMIVPMFITYMVMILPFIKVYTSGITDINYTDHVMAIILGVTMVVECVHIPSGIYINMAGHFKAARNIQIISALVLMVTIIWGVVQANIYNIILSVLCAAIVLAFLEIGYVHTKCIKKKARIMLKLAVAIVLSTGAVFLESKLMPCIYSYFSLILWTFVIMVINIILTCTAYYIIDGPAVKKIIKSGWSAIVLFSHNSSPS